MSVRPVTAGRVALACLAGLLVARAAPPASAQPYARPAAPRAAFVEVRLPAGAELWFDGMATTQAGDRRAFTTPFLRPGLTYVYEVQARWREGGQDVVRGERVLVRGGEAVVVDFTRPGENEGGPDHLSVREIAPPSTRARAVSAAHDSLVEPPAGSATRRRLPGYMAVIDVNPALRGGGAPRPTSAIPRYMSIVEFDAPRR